MRDNNCRDKMGSKVVTLNPFSRKVKSVVYMFETDKQICDRH